MYKIVGADGKEYGPVTAEQLRQWLAEGRVNAWTRVLAEGATEWKTLAELPEFAPALAAATAPVPGPIQVPPTPKTNGMALTGLILGIVSLTFGLCCCSGLPFSVLGVIFSAIGLSQINRDPQNQQGRGLAIAGLVVSILGLLVGLLLVALGFAFDLSNISRKIERL